MVFLNQALEATATVDVTDHLLSGFTGLGWLAEHFRRQKNKRWPFHRDPNSDLDKLLLSKVRQGCLSKTPLGPYSLADTWVGYGVYALERWPHENSPKLLLNVIKLLTNKAKRTPHGLAWQTTKKALAPWIRKHFSRGPYDLGVAHGNAGVIGFLSSVLRQDPDNKNVRKPLREAIDWLLSQDSGKHYSPYATDKDKIKSEPRLAWCYGDLGISIVLLNAAMPLKNTELAKRALDIAKRATHFSRSQSGVVDSYMCHGASGAFHIFNRLYHKTGEKIFLESSQNWASVIFDLLENPSDVSQMNFSFLEGKTGIGLSLLSGLSKIEPAWDRILLLS